MSKSCQENPRNELVSNVPPPDCGWISHVWEGHDQDHKQESERTSGKAEDDKAVK